MGRCGCIGFLIVAAVIAVLGAPMAINTIRASESTPGEVVMIVIVVVLAILAMAARVMLRGRLMRMLHGLVDMIGGE